MGNFGSQRNVQAGVNNFHKTKKSAAVLKHAIINQYATPFASKTGSTSLNNRVAFIDGYAGPGRYENGEEGSGAMLLRKAKELAKLPRQVECHFVEEDPEVAARLREVAAVEGTGVAYTIDDGDISTHQPTLLESAKGIPLFTYLDPCGLIIPLDEVASIFERPSGPGSPATEVLINLTAHLRRFGGILNSPNPIEASLKRIDAVCGGDWWRDTWLQRCPSKDASEDERMAAEEAVVAGYAEKLRERAGGAGTWIIDVKPRADLKPVYYLIFATRYIEGLLAFGESASLGLQEWRKYLAKVSAEGTLFADGGSWEKEWKAQEKVLRGEWVDTLAARITAELAKGEAFRIIDRAGSVLGGDLVGLVRTMHLREAINRVRDEGKTSTETVRVKDMLTLLLKPT
jgi:three-Cys-motif partner protein